jgi:ArsR family transcriptional regulator
MTVRTPTQPALSAKQFDLVAKALSDPRRMALLEAIGSEKEYACSKLCQVFPLSKGTVSHHMKELINAGLVQPRREGQYMHFEIRREVLAAYTAELMRRVVQTNPNTQ